jgi:uncharacterized protein DUF6378
MIAADVCTRAADLVDGDRRRQHGEPEVTHACIAALWSTYLADRQLTGHDVAMMLLLVKVARITTGTLNPDNYVDICGYAGIAAELAGDA